jgi:hypothetical protein
VSRDRIASAIRNTAPTRPVTRPVGIATASCRTPRRAAARRSRVPPRYRSGPRRRGTPSCGAAAGTGGRAAGRAPAHTNRRTRAARRVSPPQRLSSTARVFASIEADHGGRGWPTLIRERSRVGWGRCDRCCRPVSALGAVAAAAATLARNHGASGGSMAAQFSIAGRTPQRGLRDLGPLICRPLRVPRAR